MCYQTPKLISIWSVEIWWRQQRCRSSRIMLFSCLAFQLLSPTSNSTSPCRTPGILCTLVTNDDRFVTDFFVQSRYLFVAHSFGNSISNTRRVVAQRTTVSRIEQHDHRTAEGESPYSTTFTFFWSRLFHSCTLLCRFRRALSRSCVTLYPTFYPENAPSQWVFVSIIAWHPPYSSRRHDLSPTLWVLSLNSWVHVTPEIGVFSHCPFFHIFRYKVTPEIVWGTLHGLIGLGMVAWWQVTVPLTSLARAASKGS